jgi:hypothetical protein
VARILDANAHFAGQEPKFGIELTKLQLVLSLNWYNQNKVAKDAEKYAIDYFKKKHKLDISDISKNYTNTFGWVCRIISNGAALSTKDQIWFDNKIEEIKTLCAEKQTIAVVPKTNVISIQDRIADKVSELAGEIEGSIDDYILSDFATMPSPYAIMQNKAKGIHASKIIDIFKSHRAEFDEALTTKDSQLKEGYSNFSKSEIKKLIAYCDLIITDAMKISGESIQTRKPRKRKTKSPEQLVAKIKYMEKFDELKLTSIAPKDIIGAMTLWVYNTKTRKMGCYHASDAGGLSMKGSTVLNFNEAKSVQKKLRKPEQMLPDVLNGGKVFLRNVIESIRAVESPLTGRLNADTILLKVTK